MKSIDYSTPGYQLHVGIGKRWHIKAGTEGLRPWVKKFARIMELNSCKVKNTTKLIYSINSAENNKASHPEIQGHHSITAGNVMT